MELVSGALEETFSIATITDFATIYMTFEVMTALSCFVHGKFGQANRTLDVDDEVAYALVRGGTQSYIPDHFRRPTLVSGAGHAACRSLLQGFYGELQWRLRQQQEVLGELQQRSEERLWAVRLSRPGATTSPTDAKSKGDER
ncbi:unnamed protein product [Durusdinium trenchii]|uniref:Uncharacterized protein n=1 Tax=Durusdinium trenchii TaxID=1381693 RepID=A0ABP0Q9E9_9DINO